MSPAFRRYIDGLNELRRVRENLRNEEQILVAEEDRIEAQLDQEWEGMTADEQHAAWQETWRASPEKYEQRMRPLRDTDVWSDPQQAVRQQGEAA